MGSPFARFMALSLAVGCAGAAIGLRMPETAASPAQSSQALTDSGSSAAFEGESQRWIDEVLRSSPAQQSDAAAALRTTLLNAKPVPSTRAAVLLGALVARLDPSSAAARQSAISSLRDRLAARVDTGARWSVGADVAAARALDALGRASEYDRGETLGLLTALSCGDAPHPNLAVRVECAASALVLLENRKSVESDAALTGFLLAVLRAETPDQVKSPRTWPRITTLAWVKTRASMALARRTGLEDRYRPDGSWAHQVAEANRLEAAL